LLYGFRSYASVWLLFSNLSKLPTNRYLGGAFDVESLVENLLSKLAGNQDIVVNVYDVTNASEAMVLYGPPSPDDKVPLLHVSTLDFGDPFRRHEMGCRLVASVPLPRTQLLGLDRNKITLPASSESTNSYSKE
jgi:hypothetical protein